jgi:Domain of unknown function (DUF6438)
VGQALSFRRSIVGATALSLVLACGGNSAATPASAPTGDALGAGDVIMLYRSPCYAACPVYLVRLRPEGLVSYEGREGVAVLGRRTAEIPQSRVNALLHELEAAGYFLFADRYRPSEAVCGRYVPDAPTVITSVRWGGRLKRIEHDRGCGAAPQALGVLEQRIDEVLGTRRWTGR